MKPTKRKGFNFLRSYLDVFSLLTTDKDKVDLLECIFNKQFYGIESDLTKLSPMCAMAYVSQKHSLDKSVKGFEDKTGNKLTPLEHTYEAKPITLEHTFEQVQEEEEEKEQGKGEEEVKEEYIKEKKEINNLEVEFIEVNTQLTIIDEIEERKNIPLKKEKFNFRKEMLLLGFEEDLVVDWLSVRKTKKATNTLTSLKSFCNQVGKTGLPINEVLKLCIEKDWKGFNHEWLNNLKNKNGKQNSSSAEQHISRMQNANNSVDEFLKSQE